MPASLAHENTNEIYRLSFLPRNLQILFAEPQPFRYVRRWFITRLGCWLALPPALHALFDPDGQNPPSGLRGAGCFFALRQEWAMSNLTENTAGNLIAAEQVKGTSVYNNNGEKLGHIEDIMIDKVSGRAIYAIMSFGGFLGVGEKQHPLPWATLHYDERMGGYVVKLDRKTLEAAPSYQPDDFKWTQEYGRQVDTYYNVPSYWL
jgi:hypothetical protein